MAVNVYSLPRVVNCPLEPAALRVKRKVEGVIGKIVEYPALDGKPGSSPDGWYFQDWLEAKVEGFLKRGGERV